MYSIQKMVVLDRKPRQEQHFLVVSLGFQSHINPALSLARRLTRAGARATFSTANFCHRLMFPDKHDYPLTDPTDPLLSYFPYYDGFDDEVDRSRVAPAEYGRRFRACVTQTLKSITSKTADKPGVTCIVYDVFVSCLPAVARDLGLPAVPFWIQPATLFSLYYHYFHRGDSSSSSSSLEVPGFSHLGENDLPSFLVHLPNSGVHRHVFAAIEEFYHFLDFEIEIGKAVVLVNTFDALEESVLSEINKKEMGFQIIPVGPCLPSMSTNGFVVKDIVKHTNSIDYMTWLDQWPEKSVVYLSFGSLSSLSKNQKEEFSRSLVDCGRPYLWVIRDGGSIEEEEDDVDGGGGGGGGLSRNGGRGMVVGWCSQLEVLSHKSIGCFVTHCGWNSTLDGLTNGVPMIGFPQWCDQPTNAALVEGLWRTGVRAAVNDGGVLVEGKELRRCLDLVMGDGELGKEIRMNGRIWKERASDAVAAGGSSDTKIRAFIDDMSSYFECY